MGETWLLVDVPNICHRFHHSLNIGWEKGSVARGATYGLLSEIPRLQQRFQTPRIAFCFDSARSKRKEFYPRYKAKRTENHRLPEMDWDRKQLRREIDRLRTEVLPAVGFRNVFLAEGYEADDIIASICWEPIHSKAVIVSNDSDLYQLLSSKVSMYKGGNVVETSQTFKERVGICPGQWASVKAVAGCVSDGIPGIEGIAEKNAVKFLSGELPKHGMLYQRAICPRGQATIGQNLRLVSLPYEGCPSFKLVRDEITVARWRKVVKGLGFDRLKFDNPVPSRVAV